MKFVEFECASTGRALSINPVLVHMVYTEKVDEIAIRISDYHATVLGTRAEVVAKLEAEGLPPITPAFHKALHEACQDVRELLDHLGITEIPRSLGTNVALFSEYTIETTEMYNRLRAKYPKKEEGERESPLPPSLGHSC